MVPIGAVGSFDAPFRHKLGRQFLALNAESAGLNQERPPLAMRDLADFSESHGVACSNP